MKFCSHPLCCRIRFPLFSEGQRPWKHLWLSRSPEPASSSSTGQGITSQPPLSTQMARSTKLKWGMERDDQCLQKKGCRELNPSHPFSWRAMRGRKDFTAPAQKLYPAKHSGHRARPPGYPWAAPKNYQQVGEMSEAAGLMLHWEERKAGKHNSNTAPAGELFQQRSQPTGDFERGLWNACFWKRGATCAALNPSY